MSASNLPSISESCDFFIREAVGGWIVSYIDHFEIDEDGDWSTFYAEQVFTDERALSDFLFDRMTKFKLWRGRRCMEVADKPGFVSYMDDDPKESELPRPGKRTRGGK